MWVGTAGPVLANLGGGRQRFQVAQSYKLGTGAMAVDGRHVAVSKQEGVDPVSKNHIQLGVKSERIDAGRDSRTCIARSSSQARTN